MSLQSAADVPLLISSPNSSSERRISPSWTIAHLKTRLEPITGIPAACQQLSLRVASQDPVALVAADEENIQLAAFPLQPYAEITVSASSPSYCIATASLVLDPFDMLSSRRLPHLLALPPPPAWLPTPLETALLTRYVHVLCLLSSYSLLRVAAYPVLPRNAQSIFVSLAVAGKSILRLLRRRLPTCEHGAVGMC